MGARRRKLNRELLGIDRADERDDEESFLGSQGSRLLRFLLLISSMSLQYNDAINACEVMKPCVCSWQKRDILAKKEAKKLQRKVAGKIFFVGEPEMIANN